MVVNVTKNFKKKKKKTGWVKKKNIIKWGKHFIIIISKYFNLENFTFLWEKHKKRLSFAFMLEKFSLNKQKMWKEIKGIFVFQAFPISSWNLQIEARGLTVPFWNFYS